MAILQVFVSRKSAQVFSSKGFVPNLLRSLKSTSRFLVKVLASKQFYLAKSVFCGLRFVWLSQVSKTGFSFLAKVLTSLVQAFLPGSFFLAKVTFRKVIF